MVRLLISLEPLLPRDWHCISGHVMLLQSDMSPVYACFQKYLKEAKKASKALLEAEKGPAKAAPVKKAVLDRFKKKPL